MLLHSVLGQELFRTRREGCLLMADELFWSLCGLVILYLHGTGMHAVMAAQSRLHTECGVAGMQLTLACISAVMCGHRYEHAYISSRAAVMPPGSGEHGAHTPAIHSQQSSPHGWGAGGDGHRRACTSNSS